MVYIDWFSARILIVLDIPLETEFHRQKKGYFMAISALANGKKVVFVNSYQKASKYFFLQERNLPQIIMSITEKSNMIY